MDFGRESETRLEPLQAMTQIELPEAVSATRVASRVRRSLEFGEPASEVMDAQPTAVAWWFVGLSGLCVLAMVCAGILGARGCRVTPIQLALGHETEVSIALPANTPCTIRVEPGSATLDGLRIEVPPERGTLTPRGRTGVVYRPRAGFKGSDAFDFSLRGGSPAAYETSTIRVRASIN
jgi:hypothetical protein